MSTLPVICIVETTKLLNYRLNQVSINSIVAYLMLLSSSSANQAFARAKSFRKRNKCGCSFGALTINAPIRAICIHICDSPEINLMKTYLHACMHPLYGNAIELKLFTLFFFIFQFEFKHFELFACV